MDLDDEDKEDCDSKQEGSSASEITDDGVKSDDEEEENDNDDIDDIDEFNCRTETPKHYENLDEITIVILQYSQQTSNKHMQIPF